jgi:hypothetical protein
MTTPFTQKHFPSKWGMTLHPTKFEEQLLEHLTQFFPNMNKRAVAKLALNYGIMNMMQAYGGLSPSTIVEETNDKGITIRKEETGK